MHSRAPRPVTDALEPRAVGRDGRFEVAPGRWLAYRTFGDAAGTPIIALHGTPGSRLKFTVADPIARRLGQHVIAVDRWGYGDTASHPAPSLAAFAVDIAALADALGLGRFAVMGVSGGGPFAVAVATELAERVSAVALVAPVGPIASEADDEITAFHRFCFGRFARSPAAIRAVFGGFKAALALSPALGLRAAMIRAPEADRAVSRQPDVAARLAETFIEGLRPGAEGPVTDLGIFAEPWGLDLGWARSPACLWLGTEDRNVPGPAARRLARRLPDCRIVEIQGAGHLWIANNYHAVLGWIAETSSAGQERLS